MGRSVEAKGVGVNGEKKEDKIKEETSSAVQRERRVCVTRNHGFFFCLYIKNL
jgi:hypothetical protein